jgi:AcrR family transcriptional regulator
MSDFQTAVNEAPEETRKRIMAAMLTCCGTAGFPNVSIKMVCRRSGDSVSDFSRYFEGKMDCFHQAYEAESERVVGLILGARHGPCRVQNALEELAAFMASDPALAKGVLAEVHWADQRTYGKRLRILQRLSDALDATCRREGSLAPPATGEFFVHAIDRIASTALIERKAACFSRDIPAVLTLIGRAYEPKGASGL